MVMPPVSLAELRAHTNFRGTETVDNDELLSKLDAATRHVEGKCGAMVPRTVTSTVRGANPLLLPQWPVLSVATVTGHTSLVDAGAALAVLDLVGQSLYLDSAVVDSYYYRPRYVVTYVAGRDPVPEDLREAVLVMAAHLWETQRGPVAAATPFSGGGASTGSAPAGFAVPNRAAELMEPYMSSAIA